MINVISTVIAAVLAVICVILIINNIKIKKTGKDFEREAVAAELALQNFEDRIVIVTDSKPKKENSQSFALKLSNELKPYFKEDGKNLSLTILKNIED